MTRSYVFKTFDTCVHIYAYIPGHHDMAVLMELKEISIIGVDLLYIISKSTLGFVVSPYVSFADPMPLFVHCPSL